MLGALRAAPLIALPLAGLTGFASASRALPDLTTEILTPRVTEGQFVPPDDVAEGCAGGSLDRRLLRYGLRTSNVGTDDLVLGDPDCPDCSTNPGAACVNPLYQCSPAHGHAHFEEYALAELVDGTGTVVASGQKQGFCLLDVECATPQFHCGYQGITAGCADVYALGTPCQYIDLTDVVVPDGIYTLRVTVDYLDALAEEDETNNTDEVQLRIGDPPTGCGDGVLDAGELCDDGNTDDGDCCSADCSFAEADGTACDEPGHCLVGGACQAGDCQDATVFCDACLTCLPPEGCVPPTAGLCETLPPERSKLHLKRRAGRPGKDKLSWSWNAGAPVALSDFGNPAEVTDLSLCVFDEEGLVVSATAPSGGECGGKACWKAREKKVTYADPELTPDGVRKLMLRGGDAGKARIRAQGRGDDLDLPLHALSGEVTVRLQRSGGPACWEARFPEADRNDFERYKARVRN